MSLNMSDPLVLTWIFGAAIILRSLTAIKSWKEVGLWLFGWVIAFMIAVEIHEDTNPTGVQLLTSILLWFAFSVATLLYKNLLPKINEQILLQLSMIFVYCFLKFIFPMASWMFIPLVAILVIFCLIVYLCLIDFVLPNFLKKILFAWFFLINVFFILFYFLSDTISLFRFSEFIFSSPYDAFVTGATAFYLMTNLGFLYLLIPWRSKRETHEEAMKRWRKYMNALVEKHDDTQLYYLQTAVILGLGGMILSFNLYANVIADDILIPSFLFISQVFASNQLLGFLDERKQPNIPYGINQ